MYQKREKREEKVEKVKEEIEKAGETKKWIYIRVWCNEPNKQ